MLFHAIMKSESVHHYYKFCSMVLCAKTLPHTWAYIKFLMEFKTVKHTDERFHRPRFGKSEKKKADEGPRGSAQLP